MSRKNFLSFSIMAGVVALTTAACDRPLENGDQAAGDGTSSVRVACVDPATGELIQPGPDVDCSLPAETKTGEEPEVRDLEGGGKIVDLKGQFDQNQAKPASPNRFVVIDRETGDLLTERPTDAKAAARYDRSVARAQILMKREAGKEAATILYSEALAAGGVMVDLQGHFQVPLVATQSADGQVRVQHQY